MGKRWREMRGIWREWEGEGERLGDRGRERGRYGGKERLMEREGQER